MKAITNTSSVDKAFGLLEFLAGSGRPVSLQEAALAVKLPKPTAYRLLQALQKLGYISRPSGSRDYLIGPRIERLAVADPHARLKAAARPLLQALHRQFDETVNLGTLSDGRVHYLDFQETTQPLRFIVSPGQSDPYYCTALGRALAAELTDAQLETLLGATRLSALTPKTVGSMAELRRRIARVRESGYAEEIEESVPGVSCLAASLAPLGFPQAAISVALPVQRLTANRKASIIRALKSLGGT